MSNITDHDNFLMILRKAAMGEPRVDLRYGLRSAADGIQAAIHEMCAGNATAHNLTELNGLWAYAGRLLSLHHAPPAPIPPQQSAEQPQRKAA